MRNSKTVLFDNNPGRNAQTIGIAREIGTNIELIHEPSVGGIGNKAIHSVIWVFSLRLKPSMNVSDKGLAIAKIRCSFD